MSFLKANFIRFFLFAFISTCAAVQSNAQIAGPGDIAFSGYTSVTSDEFSFVLLKSCTAGTVIHFTDRGWTGAPTNAFNTSVEETVDWTCPAGGLPAGTEIQIVGLTANRAGGGAAGTVTGTAINLSTGGDQVLAYLGTVASPTFLSGIHMNVYQSTAPISDPVSTTAANWDLGNENNTNGSALPPGEVSAIASSKVITLKWTLPVAGDIQSVLVYRAPENGKESLLKTLDGKAESFTDDSAEKGKMYYYFIVIKYKNGLESRPADAVSARI